jgi:hypothetical protein
MNDVLAGAVMNSELSEGNVMDFERVFNTIIAQPEFKNLPGPKSASSSDDVEYLGERLPKTVMKVQVGDN